MALSPEKIVEGVAGSATSTVYTIMAIKLRVEAQQDGRVAGLELIIGVYVDIENLRPKDQLL